MKLTKDEIDEIVREFGSNGWGEHLDRRLRDMLTKKFGETKPENPYASMSDCRSGPHDKTYGYSAKYWGAKLALVPELWAAAKGVDESRSAESMANPAAGFDWEKASRCLELLRAVLKRIDEVKP